MNLQARQTVLKVDINVLKYVKSTGIDQICACISIGNFVRQASTIYLIVNIKIDLDLVPGDGVLNNGHVYPPYVLRGVREGEQPLVHECAGTK